MTFMMKRMITNGKLSSPSLTPALNILKRILKDLLMRPLRLNLKVQSQLLSCFKNSKTLRQEKQFKRNFKRNTRTFYINMKRNLLKWKEYSTITERNLQ